ncbi:alkyl hydroperoxide reductase/ Thiol specific antioxidant/ Mal allergen [Alkalidesulfovibrio alkalitolerans DSM 16529]|uniref:Alkyl hydroperoxide reductase C n=1 Tax=Alkalidesulfovibrio alkalitolerans DSM 16529 TaxID=1121439 RepID=S7T7G3_9BACT|nr:redoxin domain-containing protein [Alkalidesulfovibrio alkalitolerans]EPR32435.1 alkyl hydroperoxide reductase/ Thiol specific antioxidant/ Mal allergen [Alkalidesulfovibrio alkalitolerans DSM 16529]
MSEENKCCREGHHHHHCCCDQHARIGKEVENFKMEVYDPKEGGFGEIELKKLRKGGKWVVLVFYPADFTFVCPTELADLADKHPELKELGCEVISVSTDTKFTHMAWRTDERLLANVGYKMAADPTGKISRYFGVYDGETGLALRGTFVINPEGVLVGSEINFYNVGRNADELVRKMKANVYLKDHPAEACPAKWEPGKKTLTPSEKLVGKVYEALND